MRRHLALFLALAATAQAGTAIDKLTQQTVEALAGQPMPGARRGLRMTVPLVTPRHQAELREVVAGEVRALRLLGHANVPLKVLMVCNGSTWDEVTAMVSVVKDINKAARLPEAERLKLLVIPVHGGALKGLPVSREDFDRYVEVCPYFWTDDIWMQDWGEVAAVLTADAREERLCVLDSNRGRGLAELPGILARMWSADYVKPAGLSELTAGNYGGNIEVTPDDILYVGSTSEQPMRELLASGGYRDRMVVLDTSWLNVGHVDEFVTCLPTPGTPLGYTLLKADPRLGMRMIRDLGPTRWRQAVTDLLKNFHSLRQATTDGLAYDRAQLLQMTEALDQLHDGTNKTARGEANSEDLRAGRALVSWNHQAARTIDAQVDLLVQKIREVNGEDTPVDVVSIPSLFQNFGGKALALLPGVVNLVVLRDHLVVPDPLLPQFRDDVTAKVQALGYTPHYIPNGSYHFQQGQLHCGTNILRHPNRFIHPRYEENLRRTRFEAQNR